MINRRTLMAGSVTLTAIACSPKSKTNNDNTPHIKEDTDVKNPDPNTIPDYDKWQLSDAEWKERLAPDSYAVLRKEATERPFTSLLNNEKREGIFACAGCGLDLFTSDKKYESGTGWPSFWDVIPGAMGTKTDFKIVVPRTEYHCARCGGHQGHVFKDGPQPTGLRYCNNGVALTFKPA